MKSSLLFLWQLLSFRLGLTFHPLKGEQDFTHMLRVVGGALDCSVESFPTVDGVSIRPADTERHSGRHVLDKYFMTKASDMHWHTFQGYSTQATYWQIWRFLSSWCCPTALWLSGCSCSGAPGKELREKKKSMWRWVLSLTKTVTHSGKCCRGLETVPLVFHNLEIFWCFKVIWQHKYIIEYLYTFELLLSFKWTSSLSHQDATRCWNSSPPK